ncbi:MAG: SEC-C metal-binding domain-containing protein [Armatimonadota bacterium]
MSTNNNFNVLCAGLRRFFRHSLPVFESLAEDVRDDRRRARLIEERVALHAGLEQKIGRNDPCPCGSGLKYKKCHGSFVP